MIFKAIETLCQWKAYDESPELDALFTQAMAENYAWQYDHVPYVRHLGARASFKPAHVKTIQDCDRIPHLFVGTLKRHAFCSVDKANIALQLSSSGTQGQASLAILDAGSLDRIQRMARQSFIAMGYQSATPAHAFIAGYEPQSLEARGTSWSDEQMLSLSPLLSQHWMIRWDEQSQSHHFDAEGWARQILELGNAAPIRFLGFPAFIHQVVERIHAANRAFRLHPESYVLAGGGWKTHTGQSMTHQSFARYMEDMIGLPAINVRDTYGMVEHGIPYNACEWGHHHVSSYARLRVLDPMTLEALPDGQEGVLQLMTPFNLAQPNLSILSTDLAIILPNCPCGRPGHYLASIRRGGRRLHKGCAIAAQDILDQQKGTPASTPQIQGANYGETQSPSWEDTHHRLWGKTWERARHLSLEAAQEAFSVEHLSRLRQAFGKTSLDRIFQLLAQTGERLTDPKGPYHQEAMARLPKQLEYSPAMVQQGLEMLYDMTRPQALRERLVALDNPACLDHFVPYKGGYRKATGLGCLCHIAAGNVFLGSVDSLIHGIITKNINILKASSQDRLFPALFFKALEDVDTKRELLPYLCLTYWSPKEGHADQAAIDLLMKQAMDGILLFGGQSAVTHYQKDLGPNTELLAFGPKISFGLILKDADAESLEQAAQGFAKDIIYWEQRACTSCQNVFIEDPLGTLTPDFATRLNRALEHLAQALPQPQLDLDNALEIRKSRELAKWDAFKDGFGDVLESRSGHSLIIQKGWDLQDSPLNRTVILKRIEDFSDLQKGNIPHMRSHLGTVAIASQTTRPEQLERMTQELQACGILRFCEPGSMSTAGNPHAAHDGIHLTERLVRWIEKDDLPDNLGLAFMPNPEKEALLIARLESCLQNALKAPHYQTAFKEAPQHIQTLEDWKRLPILESSALTRHDLQNPMFTTDTKGFSTFSAGGSTGKQKFVAYSHPELQESQRILAQGYAAAGFTPDDCVANLLKAGALWTGFLVTHGALEQIGCRILSITGNQDERETLSYLSDLGANTLTGVTSNLIRLAECARANATQLNLDKIYYTGERMPPGGAELLKSTFGAPLLRSLGYAAVEVGPVGYQCPHCQGTEHHIHEDNCFVEQDDDGSILVTTLNRHLQPLLRYRLGDRIEWVLGACPCGRTSPRFRLKDRSDDLIMFNISHLHLDQVHQALLEHPELSSCFQIRLENKGTKRALTLQIESCATADLYPLLSKAFTETLERHCPALSQDRDINLLERITVEVLPQGCIPRLPRSGKIRRILDLR